MTVLFPLISLIFLYLIFKKTGNCWRSSALSAAIGWGVLLTAITEALSIFKLLTFGGIVSLWFLVSIGLIFSYFRLIKTRNKIVNHNYAAPIPAFSKILLSGVALIMATIGLIALVAPPNTMDSMTYHLARIMHWMQNHSVAHYPTHYEPQLYQSPWAEFAIMHFQILSGGDRFANLIQWFSMVGSSVGVSLIAKQLGANLTGQVFAAVACATLPMGILQGSSTQNDYVVSFWIVSLVYYVLLTLETGISRFNYLKIGASFGLAILTKTTAYISSFPFIVWFIFAAIKRLKLQSWQPILTISLLVFSLNFSHYIRNWDLFGSPIGIGAGSTEEYKIDFFSFPTFLSNIIRNLALHLDIVRSLGLQGMITPLTGKAEKAILLLHKFMGVDINDPRITALGQFRVPGLSFHESLAGNPIHFLLIWLAITFCLFVKDLKRKKYLVSYLIAVTSAFLLFCLLLKWQPFQSRHHLILFVLMSAFMGVVFSKVLNYSLVNVIAIILLVASVPWVFNNELRPILGVKNIFNTSRIEQYHKNRPDLTEPSVGAVNFIRAKKCPDIGLISVWEYPLWVLLQDNNDKLVRLENMNVKNVSAVKSDKAFIPCAVIDLEISEPQASKLKAQKEILLKKEIYVQEWINPPVSVFLKKDKS